MGLKIFVSVVVLAVLAAVVYGFILVGSPASQRVLRFDERRVSDLQSISFALDSYWVRNEQLPENLEALQDQRYFVRSIQDPETEEPYEYRVLSAVTYELCAVFLAESSLLPKPSFSEQPWEHGMGRTCFEREVQKLPGPAESELIRAVPVR